LAILSGRSERRATLFSSAGLRHGTNAGRLRNCTSRARKKYECKKNILHVISLQWLGDNNFLVVCGGDRVWPMEIVQSTMVNAFFERRI
jgi:hypothetical protein